MTTTPLTCADCGDGFVRPHANGPIPRRCPSCAVERRREFTAERQKAWRQANPERAKAHWTKHNDARKGDPIWLQRHRESNIKSKYGVTWDELQAMLEAQNHLCAICGRAHVGVGKRLHIDHCHTTKKVRGLLCGKCNTAVGLLDDDPERAEQLAAYLRR